MKKRSFVLLTVCVAGITLFAQATTSLAEDFIRGSLSQKLEVLSNARAARPDEAALLYSTSMDFIARSKSLIGYNDPQFRSIAIATLQGLALTHNKSYLDYMIELAGEVKDSDLEAANLSALGTLGKFEGRVVNLLDTTLKARLAEFGKGGNLNLPVMIVAINALGECGDSTSYFVLFNIYMAGISNAVSLAAHNAMAQLNSGYAPFLLSIIDNAPLEQKIGAFNLGLSVDGFSVKDKGDIAEAALSEALDIMASPSGYDSKAMDSLAQMRLSAVRIIGDIAWQDSLFVVLRYFSVAQQMYHEGSLPQTEYLAAIGCMGAMGSPEAAQRLILLVQVSNTRVADKSEYDTIVVLALVNALGRLGYRAAFDYLLQATYLPYSDEIKDAARAALRSLRM